MSNCLPRHTLAGGPEVPVGEERNMPRYMVERTFPGGLEILSNSEGAQAMAGVVANNATSGVTWITSYVTTDKMRTVCIYDGPDPEAIRKVAGLNGLPVDTVTPVRVLDPYFYFGGAN